MALMWKLTKGQGASDKMRWQIILMTIWELTRANQNNTKGGGKQAVTDGRRWRKSRVKDLDCTGLLLLLLLLIPLIFTMYSSSSYLYSTSLSSSSFYPSSSSSFSKQLPAASFEHPALLHWWRVFFSLTTTTRMLFIGGGLTQNLFVLPSGGFGGSCWVRLLIITKPTVTKSLSNGSLQRRIQNQKNRKHWHFGPQYPRICLIDIIYGTLRIKMCFCITINL